MIGRRQLAYFHGLGDTCTISAGGARVCTADDPSIDAWQNPDVSGQRWTDQQKLSVSTRVKTALQGKTFLNRDLSLFNPPGDSRPFITTPNPFVAYPLPGAGPIDVITKTIETGLMAVINRLAVVHVGGNPPDGTGNVIWRVLVNGAGIDGLGELTSEVGTYAQPNDFVFMVIENDIVKVTVEVPAAQPAMPAGTTTAARFHGWTYPLAQATKRPASGGVFG